MDTRPGYPYGFACRRSGNCCAIPGGFVRVTDDEAAAIAARLGMTVEAFRSRHLRPDGMTLVDGLNGACTFLQEGRPAGCSIYEVRPARCRTWPFWPEVLENQELEKLVRRTCPGIVDLPAAT